MPYERVEDTGRPGHPAFNRSSSTMCASGKNRMEEADPCSPGKASERPIIRRISSAGDMLLASVEAGYARNRYKGQ
jgi:hypothetical protein